jgi:hypothetical protein
MRASSRGAMGKIEAPFYPFFTVFATDSEKIVESG